MKSKGTYEEKRHGKIRYWGLVGKNYKKTIVNGCTRFVLDDSLNKKVGRFSLKMNLIKTIWRQDLTRWQTHFKILGFISIYVYELNSTDISIRETKLFKPK